MRNTLISTFTLLGLVLTAAYAADPPPVKEGLWQIHTQSVDNPGNKKTEGTRSICRSHAYDVQVLAAAKKRPGCTVTNETVQGNKYTMTMHCVVMGSQADNTNVTTFQSDTAIHSENHMTYSPAMYGVAESTLVMD